MIIPANSSSRNEQSDSHLLDIISADETWLFKSDFLSLPGWETIAYRSTELDCEVIAKPLTTPTNCTKCGRPSEALRLNGTIVRNLVDEPRNGWRVSIYCQRQRYLCECGATLLQPLAGVAAGRGITQRGAEYVAKQAMHRSFAAAANEVGISYKTCKNLFADFVTSLELAREIETPKILGIDGVCVGRHSNKKTYCMLTDISNGSALELLPKSTMLELARFLKQLPNPENLKTVVIDMAEGTLTVIRRFYPNVPVVIDPYHVLRIANDAVTWVVKEKQKDLTAAQHKELMKGGNRFLLTTRRSSLTKPQKEKLEEWCIRVPEFKLAFELKEEVFDIWRIKNRDEAERRYDDWEKKIPKGMRQAFGKFTGAVRRWRKHIFNYFDYRVSNAYTESRNRDIKSLQRDGRRTSFPVLRARFLFAKVTLKPQRTRNRMNAVQIRAVAKAAEEVRKTAKANAPISYVARIDAARKSKNEFTKLLDPGEKWLERFGHYSSDSDQENPFKWDFVW